MGYFHRPTQFKMKFFEKIQLHARKRVREIKCRKKTTKHATREKRNIDSYKCAHICRQTQEMDEKRERGREREERGRKTETESRNKETNRRKEQRKRKQNHNNNAHH